MDLLRGLTMIPAKDAHHDVLQPCRTKAAAGGKTCSLDAMSGAV
jgi:hypothetical protein